VPIVELVVAVCLAADPATCREEHFPFVEDGGLTSCLVRAQPWIAEWQATHPQWTVRTWKCAAPRADRDA
jgi:hypothetical protein